MVAFTYTLIGMSHITQKPYWMKFLDRTNAKTRLSGNALRHVVIHIHIIISMMSFFYTRRANTLHTMFSILPMIKPILTAFIVTMNRIPEDDLAWII